MSLLDLNLDTDFEDRNVAGNRTAEEVNHETKIPLSHKTGGVIWRMGV